jgi:hypothetical protein
VSGVRSADRGPCSSTLGPGRNFGLAGRNFGLAGKPIATSWDLFGWPSPRHAMRERMDAYRAFVERHWASTAPPGPG